VRWGEESKAIEVFLKVERTGGWLPLDQVFGALQIDFSLVAIGDYDRSTLISIVLNFPRI
jgi:hypothetical protein